MMGIEFVFVAIGVSMVVRAFKGGGGRRRDRDLPAGPIVAEDPRVAMLQTEVDELRTQVERLTAAEHFYAQLQAGAPAAGAPPASPPPAPVRAPASVTPQG